jgi:hypothetical protein
LAFFAFFAFLTFFAMTASMLVPANQEYIDDKCLLFSVASVFHKSTLIELRNLARFASLDLLRSIPVFLFRLAWLAQRREAIIEPAMAFKNGARVTSFTGTSK